MPVKVKREGRKFRVIEAGSGRLAKNASGGEVDGGGHDTQAKADAQARAINASLNNRKKGKK
jgi:hypothetical protein